VGVPKCKTGQGEHNYSVAIIYHCKANILPISNLQVTFLDLGASCSKMVIGIQEFTNFQELGHIMKF